MDARSGNQNRGFSAKNVQDEARIIRKMQIPVELGDSIKYFKPPLFCENGGIGRRARLRIWWGDLWGFESPFSHFFV